ncbi:MAG TPA: aldehyde dehydrogenase family protein, partial [Desulforhopalus sp.]|nr:aldehyde dehydrogenase family protein [Desulforhopalus sp.]
MNFLDELYLEKNMSGCSTGTAWLTTSRRSGISAFSPVDGTTFAQVGKANAKNYEQVISEATMAFPLWRSLPAPRRGEVVRQIGQRLRDFKLPLATLISYETGKPIQESLGEVQEVIDICDYCLGQSRMLYGMT